MKITRKKNKKTLVTRECRKLYKNSNYDNIAKQLVNLKMGKK